MISLMTLESPLAHPAAAISVGQYLPSKITLSLCEIERAELCWGFVQSRVRGKDRAATLSPVERYEY